MELLTIRSQILSVATRWRKQYPESYDDDFKNKHQIYHNLCGLDLTTATANDVTDVIGNSEWARPQQCDECGKKFDEVIVVGGDIGYEQNSVYVCKKCLNKAIKLARHR